jgi:hypothetical protein
MKRLIAVLGFTILTLAFAKPLLAQEPASDPLFSMKRTSLAAGVDKEVLLSLATDQQEWSGVIAGAYNVLSPKPGASGPRISLTARFSQPFDLDARPSGVIGFRVTLYRGAP